MNAIALIILAALMIDSIVNLIADVLNLKQLKPELPSTFKQWYEPEQYRRSQEYLRANTRFGWIVSAVDLFVLLVFWFAGGFAILDGWVRSFGFSPVVSGLIYIGVLAVLKSIVGEPFAIYDTFVIEERFGFNKTTWRTYVTDKIKSALLGLTIGGAVLALVLAFFEFAGPNAWWYCWGATVAIMLLVQYVAPTWIMPLFNRFEPLPEGELRNAIVKYARRIDFALDNIFLMDGSKRSTKANAYFTGFGRHRRIVLFDTLIEKHSVESLVAVLAHEMGHFKQKHIFKMLLIGVIQTGVMFYILSWFISYSELFQAFYVKQPSVYAGLIFFGMLFSPISTLLGIAVNALSRHHEFAADRFAVETAPQGRALAEALKKLSVDNLSNLEPHPFYVFLNYSHPPVLKRVAAIEAIAA